MKLLLTYDTYILMRSSSNREITNVKRDYKRLLTSLLVLLKYLKLYLPGTINYYDAGRKYNPMKMSTEKESKKLQKQAMQSYLK